MGMLRHRNGHYCTTWATKRHLSVDVDVFQRAGLTRLLCLLGFYCEWLTARRECCAFYTKQSVNIPLCNIASIRCLLVKAIKRN